MLNLFATLAIALVAITVLVGALVIRNGQKCADGALVQALWQIHQTIEKGLGEMVEASPEGSMEAVHERIAVLSSQVVELGGKVEVLPATWEDIKEKMSRLDERIRGRQRALRDAEEIAPDPYPSEEGEEALEPIPAIPAAVEPPQLDQESQIFLAQHGGALPGRS